MDGANRQLTEDEQYRRSLEELVKARTDQLMQTTSQNSQLMELLKQIQSMESLEQVREAVQACLKKFMREPTPTPKLGGEAGEPVPEVDPQDLRAIWLMGNEAQAGHPRSKAAGLEVMKSFCKPGANVEATWYRSTFIWMLTQLAKPQLTPYLIEGNGLADPVFRTMASIPMEWVGPEVRQDLPFDVSDFLDRLSEQ
ncbi:MAG TPA: hypothetical protein VFE61_26555 [Candidatus Sulfotelmatobacter sp.]|jgi:hypothetical protein|nr:hypothetical protein [Candidatus Sulfotelmatobacter sp.]